jgi:cytochrome c551
MLGTVAREARASSIRRSKGSSYMRASLVGMLMLVAVVLLASGCNGAGTKKQSLADACDRQIKQIQDEASESKIKESKSSEDATKREHLVECAGQPAPASASSDQDGSDSKSGSGDDAAAGADAGGGAKLTDAMLTDERATFSKTCSSCHTLADAKAAGTFGPNLDDLELDADAITGQIENGGGGMPPKLLTGDDVQAMADYILQVQAGK